MISEGKMTEKKWQKHVFLTSLILTIIVFSLSILISYGMDFWRVDEVIKSINNHKLDTDSYIVEKEFMETFGRDKCGPMSSRMYDLKQEAEEVGKDLSKYGQKSLFKKNDFDYLKRKYFLLELKTYVLVNELNKNCNNQYVPLLFFYKIDDDLSERQGYILSDLAEAHKKEVITFSFDKDYEDEPLLKLFLLKYNVTAAPTIIINDNIKVERFIYQKEIETMIGKFISPIDQPAKNYDLTFTLRATGINITEYISNLTLLINQVDSNLVKGDIYLVLGRLKGDEKLICLASDYYKNASAETPYHLAVIYETIASLNCNGEKKEAYLNAAYIWKGLGNYFRAELDKSLAYGIDIKFYYNLDDVKPINKIIDSWERIIIGESSFKISSSDILVSQTDRVTRDWLSNQFQQPYSEKLLTTFSEKFYLSEPELLPEIGWHEGARIKELVQSGLSHKIASGTLVKKINGKWYAASEKGVFQFEVPEDKILYPTTRFLREDIALVIDTHGMNMIVDQVMRERATVAVACCDSPGKVKAAKYLSDKGIKVICLTDKYLPLLIFSGANVLGSPPITKKEDYFTIGGRRVEITRNDKVIAMNATDDEFSLGYYQTPANYFSMLKESIPSLEVYYVTVSGFDQMDKVIEAAEKKSAKIIAVRVYNSNDYSAVKKWLAKDLAHKAILFHSESYPYGYLLFKEFPGQTSFDDINPIIKFTSLSKNKN